MLGIAQSLEALRSDCVQAPAVRGALCSEVDAAATAGRDPGEEQRQGLLRAAGVLVS